MQEIKPHEIHMPKPSLIPAIMALSLTLMALGVIFTWVLSVVGAVGLLATLVAWMLENRFGPQEDEESE